MVYLRKVLVIANVISMISQFNRNNISVLQGLGFEVHVACNLSNTSFSPNDANKEYVKGFENSGVIFHQVDFERRTGAYKTIRKCCRQIENILEEGGFEFVHCHSPIAGLCGRIAAKKCKVKSVYTAHGFMFYRGASLLKWMIFFPQEWLQSWNTDVLITINKEDYSIAKKYLHAKKIYYVPGVGVDIDKFSNISKKREQTRKELGISDTDFFMLSVGELSVRKNQEAAIKAVARVNDSRIKYCLVGQGAKENDFRKMINELEIEDQVKLLGYRTDVAELYHAADLFVFPSIQEGLPVALMEAMACKVPVICSKIRGSEELILNDDYLFNAGDINQIANLIKTIIDSNDLTTVVKNNFLRIKTTFSVENVNKYLTDIYKKV
jgi:glycosyltransferase involved in cell wall biosynthesis